MEKYDFSGWATKNDIRCSDGRTIRHNAFIENDGQVVPLVWQHQHNDPTNVLGHALLENRDEGVYAYGTFNDTEAGRHAKTLVEHGDVVSLSIYANQLKQKGGDVLHGKIREVSLVLAGANPGAFIDFPILEHGEESESEAVIYNDSEVLTLSHEDKEVEEKEETKEEEKPEMAEKEKTVKDVFDEFTEEQKQVVYFMIGQALEEAGVNTEDEEVEHYDEEGETFMKHNVFDNETANEAVLSHDAMDTIIKDAKKQGSLKESFLAHAEDYGIDGIEWLFPEDHDLNNTPEWIKRDTGWVSGVMNGVNHTPFSRLRRNRCSHCLREARLRRQFIRSRSLIVMM